MVCSGPELTVTDEAGASHGWHPLSLACQELPSSPS